MLVDMDRTLLLLIYAQLVMFAGPALIASAYVAWNSVPQRRARTVTRWRNARERMHIGHHRPAHA
jgi:hypothetical protein